MAHPDADNTLGVHFGDTSSTSDHAHAFQTSQSGSTGPPRPKPDSPMVRAGPWSAPGPSSDGTARVCRPTNGVPEFILSGFRQSRACGGGRCWRTRLSMALSLLLFGLCRFGGSIPAGAAAPGAGTASRRRGARVLTDRWLVLPAEIEIGPMRAMRFGGRHRGRTALCRCRAGLPFILRVDGALEGLVACDLSRGIWQPPGPEQQPCMEPVGRATHGQ